MPLLLLVHEPIRYVAKEWYLESIKCVRIPVGLNSQNSHQADVAEEYEPAQKGRP